MAADVVVTGLGTVTSLGGDTETTWEQLKAGTSGAGGITEFDAGEFSQCPDLACEVPVEPTDEEIIDAREMGRYTQYAALAAEEALADSGLAAESSGSSSATTGVSIGTGIGGLPEQSSSAHQLSRRGRIGTRTMLNFLPNLAAGQLSILFDAGGPNHSASTACAAGAHSIITAVDDIRLGRADVMIAGGAEAAICPLGIAGFGAMRALSTRDQQPTRASRPFETSRDGFVMSEGAGVVILESRDHAVSRGAEPLAELSGVGLSGDATHPTKPHEEAWGLRRAMEMAISDGDPANAVDLICAHATSTPRGDAHEAKAIAQTFDSPPPVTAPKSMLGHSLGASGAIEAVLSVKALRSGTIPPTINHETTGDNCGIPVVDSRTEQPIDTVLSNAAGFGGTNAVLLFEAT